LAAAEKDVGVFSLQKATRNLAPYQRAWKKLAEQAKTAPAARPAPESRLREVKGFGSNPGELRMFTYVPPAPSALAVVLHGGGQTAAGYDLGAGWSTLAERYGFALLLPEQQAANQRQNCFTWYEPGDSTRGRGEALSIRQMVEKLVVDHQIDRTRVYVTGLSAGGAMTSVMLATYPEVFAAGAIIAGLPYGAASNVQEALARMFHDRPRPAREWGDLVRAASPHVGPWPRVSVWHGAADAIVKPSNAGEIVKQWTDVHGLPPTPDREEMVDGYPRQVWRVDGVDVIESYTITGMAHGTPLASGDAAGQCGVPGPFLLEAGISSSFHIAKFWGLVGAAPRAAEKKLAVIPPRPSRAEPEPRRGGDTRAEPDGGPAHGMDIHRIITKALQAAGLVKPPR
jgi:poly(hydroxyalkanoate) depolymerase family esterase